MVGIATCGYWAPEMWLVQTEMGYRWKIHTEFQRLSMEKKKSKNISTFYIGYIMKWQYFDLYIGWQYLDVWS